MTISSEKLESLMTKIAGLLRLSKSSNENEAAFALSKAQELMKKYNIEESDLSNTKEEIIEIDFYVAHSDTKYVTRLSYWLSKAFFCKAIMVKRNVSEDPNKIKFENEIRFIGKKSDVAVATYIFSYVSGFLAYKTSEYMKSIKSKSQKIKIEYTLGFVTAVCEKLEAIEEQNKKNESFTPAEESKLYEVMVIKNSLIVQYMNEKYNDKLHNKDAKTEMISAKNYDAGYEDGKKVGIHKGLDNKKETLTLN